MGLMALQEVEQRRRGLPVTFIGDWQNQVDHLLLQEESKQHRLTVPISMPSAEQQEEPECDMSMRPGVDKTAIESFLQLREIDDFDFYSIGLSKMERGNDRDIADVKLLVDQGIITL